MLEKKDRFDALLVVSASVLMGALLYTARSHLSPPVVALAIVALLFPLRRQPVARHLLLVLLLLFVIWLAHELRDVLFPFAASLLLAYLLDPVADRMQRWRLPRTAAVAIIVAFLVGIVVLASALIVPRILDEVGGMVEASIAFAGQARTWLERDLVPTLGRLGIGSAQIQEQLVPKIANQAEGFLKFLFQSLLQLTSSVSALLGQLLNLVLIPFLTFFLLKDFDRLRTAVRHLLPERQQRRAAEMVHSIDRVLVGFFRGELLVCLIVGTLTAILLSIFRIPYALLLGVLAGVLNLVPYVGLAITMLVGVLVGLFSPNPLVTTIKIVVLIESVQILEGSFLSPKIVGDKVGLHPAWVMFAILTFSKLWGFLGLVIAVPTAGVIATMLRSWFARVRAQRSAAVPDAP